MPNRFSKLSRHEQQRADTLSHMDECHAVDDSSQSTTASQRERHRIKFSNVDAYTYGYE